MARGPRGVLSSRRVRALRATPLAAALSLLALAGSSAGTTPDSGLAIVVHRSNPASNMSRDELARIYSGRRLRWPDGQRIVVVNQPATSAPRTHLFRILFHSGGQADFTRADGPTPFRTTVRRSDRSVVHFVSRLPNAIGYVSATVNTDAVKIVRLEGQLPGDADYLFAREPDR